MNIAFFLTPKKDVVTLKQNYTIKEAMEIMSQHKYTSVPVIDKRGHFVNTLSEGDILWYMNDHPQYPKSEIDRKHIRSIMRHHNTKPVLIDAHMDSLIELVSTQSFVPVIDDEGVFIGIIRRSDIISYTVSQLKSKTRELVS